MIVPAYNAEGTVARAVRSALMQPEATRVIVVDDASSDGTAEAARAADDGTGRLTVHVLCANGGPAAARNAAIARSDEPVIAILDADDRFAPGRLSQLLCVPDWDLIADNIAFVREEDLTDAALPPMARPAAVTTLDLEGFVRGNMTRRGRGRRELGFLHPLMRREFLERAGLAYAPDMRLGEDYDLYTRALLAGARYKLVDAVGYHAVERAGSLSGTHRTADLARLCQVDTALLGDHRLAGCERVAVLAHRANTARRYHLRAFLDAKRHGGMARAAAYLAAHPAHGPSVVVDLGRAKWDGRHASSRDRRPRTLFDGTVLAAAPQATARGDTE
ncbi:glycosyltransferase family 2 protein [Acuticoccus sp.]|uniref:glycosyltransferase family 2 protein n=1 Tax=Acuticoccus sp. TaxID=1904378 RepID=UPI003B521E85